MTEGVENLLVDSSSIQSPDSHAPWSASCLLAHFLIRSTTKGAFPVSLRDPENQGTPQPPRCQIDDRKSALGEKRVLRRILLIIAVLLFSRLAHGQEFVFETASLGPTGQPGAGSGASGAAVDSSQFLGAKFQMPREGRITSLGGHVAHDNGRPMVRPLFVAVVPLDPTTDLPATFDLSDARFSTTFLPPNPSADVAIVTDFRLPAGRYAIIFGSGRFGATGSGLMPDNNTDLGQPERFFADLSTPLYNDHPNCCRRLRFFVRGTLSAAPPPPPPPPPPPADPYIMSDEFPDFRFRVTFRPAENQADIAGVKEEQCLPETVCVSGSRSGRAELFIRLLGPRLNGFLHLNLVRFTPAEVQVEIEQLNTAVRKSYVLRRIPRDSDELTGLVDRTAFLP